MKTMMVSFKQDRDEDKRKEVEHRKAMEEKEAEQKRFSELKEFEFQKQLKEQSEAQEKLQQQRDQEMRDFALEQDRSRKEHELVIMTKQIEMEKE